MDYDAILKMFVGDDPDRPGLHHPIPEHKVTYATNGHKMIRIPNKYLKRKYKSYNKQPANCKNIVERAMKIQTEIRTIYYEKLHKQFNEIDKYPLHEEIKCPECDGTGKLECPHCGYRYFECNKCSGDGKVITDLEIGFEFDHSNYIRIGNNQFNPNIVYSLFKVMEFLKIERIAAHANIKNKACFFEYDDIIIILMPTIGSKI